MKTIELDPKLQKVVRKELAVLDWSELAEDLGITLKSVQYQLDPKSPRTLTYHFIGMLAVRFPNIWEHIHNTYTGKMPQ